MVVECITNSYMNGETSASTAASGCPPSRAKVQRDVRCRVDVTSGGQRSCGRSCSRWWAASVVGAAVIRRDARPQASGCHARGRSAGAAKAIARRRPPRTPAAAYTWTTSPITFLPASNVEDIDVTFDLTHPHASNVMTRLTRFVGTTVTSRSRSSRA